MKKISVIIESTPNYFFNWLIKKIGNEALEPIIPTEQGNINLKNPRPDRWNNPSKIIIEGWLVTPNPIDETNIGATNLIYEVVTFELSSLSPERLEITANCYQPAAEGFFGNLLAEIAKRWPETENEILEFCENLVAFILGKGVEIYKAHVEFNFSLRTTYREYLDWFANEYPSIKIIPKIGFTFDLQFKYNLILKAQLTVSPIKGGIEVTGWYDFFDKGDWLDLFKERSINYFGEIVSGEPIHKKEGKTNFSCLREERTQLFKTIKEANTKLSQREVAAKATEMEFNRIQKNLKEKHSDWTNDKLDFESLIEFERLWKKTKFTIDDVRNDYRSSGWCWERADRVR